MLLKDALKLAQEKYRYPNCRLGMTGNRKPHRDSCTCFVCKNVKAKAARLAASKV